MNESTSAERDKLIADAQWQIRLACQTLQRLDTVLERLKGVDLVRVVVQKQPRKRKKNKTVVIAST